MNFIIFIITCVLMCVNCNLDLHKILIFNDMHLNENYLKDHCNVSNCTDLGYKGEDYHNLTDSPGTLIDTVLDRAKS